MKLKHSICVIVFIVLLCSVLCFPLQAGEELKVPARFSGDFVEHLIPIDGGQLCCVRRKGTGPTLMLIPGTFSDSRTFHWLVPYLDKDLDLLLVENRGLGKSWPPPENSSIEQCARDALLIAQAMNVTSFYVGGHSLGGMISIELAGVAPEKLRGVISLEGWTHWHAARDAFDYDMKSTLTENKLKLFADYRQLMLNKWSEKQVKDFGRIWRKWDGQPILQTTVLPVLELYGDRGKTPASLEQLKIPNRKNIELKWLHNASHKIHFERPKIVADAMNQFIKNCEETR